MQKLKWLILLQVFVLMFLDQVEGASLRVSPAGFMVHNVNPGKGYDVYKETGLRLTIYNDDKTTQTYVLSTRSPSEGERWEKGYFEIPDSRWCWFEKDEMIVRPNSKGYAHLYLTIPDEDRYFNQHWLVILGVTAKPGPRGIGLAVDVRAQIETKSKVDIKGRPDGIIGFKPSTVQFQNVPPSSTQNGKVVVYNNDNKTHTYTIDSLFHNTEIRPRTYLTHSFKTIPDRKWIVLDKDRLTIEPNGDGVLSLKLNIPDEPAYYGKKWEEILLVQPDEGLSGFIRVQIETSKGNK